MTVKKFSILDLWAPSKIERKIWAPVTILLLIASIFLALN